MNKSLAFVGREKEIEQLRALHADGKYALIVGPAGIGKTALLRQVRQQTPLLLDLDRRIQQIRLSVEASAAEPAVP